MDTNELFGKEKISKVLLKIAPPVMLAQLIQALYNIVDSLFVGNYSDSGLTALSIIYPIQLLMIALAVGTGVGINTVMAAKLGAGNRGEAEEHAGIGTPLAVAAWVIFAAVCWAIMPAYARLQTDTPEVIADVVTYGRIVCVFSFGLFLESIWTKVHQAEGNMRRPMAAQIAGAVTNIILDPLLIFGMFGLPEMGIAGASEVPALHSRDLPPGNSEYPHAGGVHRLHIRAESDTCDILRPGRDRSWSVLQMAVVFLYSARINADLYSSCGELQLRRPKHRPLQENPCDRDSFRNGADVPRHAVL